MKVELTDLFLKSLKPVPGERTEIVDAGSPAGVTLILRISESRMQWSMRYREPVLAAGGTRRQIRQKIGTYPQISLKKARADAWEVSKSLQDGTWKPVEPEPAPMPETAPEPVQEPTFAEVCRDFLVEWPKQGGRRKQKVLKPRTVEEYRRQIDKVLIPALGHLRPADIRRRDINAFLRKQEKPVMKNRLLATLSAILTFCAREEIIDTNPCLGMGRPTPEEPRDRVLKDDELRILWSDWSTRQSAAGTLFKLMLLTGCRSGELKAARWEWVDLEAGTLTLPDTATKNRRRHVVPLTGRALGILQELGPRKAGWIFPASDRHRTRPRKSGTAPEHLTHLQKATQRITREVRKVEGHEAFSWNPHDIRRTVATQLSRLGFDDSLIARVLNHSWVYRNETGRVYNQDSKLPEMRVALERWSARLEQILTRKTAKVVNLSR